MKGSTRYMSRVVCVVFWATLALGVGCGSEVTELADTGGVDGGEDAGPGFDVQEPEPDAAPDAGDDDAGGGDSGQDAEDPFDVGDTPDVPIEVLRDYRVCTGDLDCPINGSRCVKFVTLNRPDAQGIQEMAIDAVIERLAPGQGVCSQNCSDDPTVCERIGWRDAQGATHGSTCALVALGEAPYRVTRWSPFEVNEGAGIDPQAMAAGQAFGALCRPSFEAMGSRGPDFCGSCESASSCSGDTFCYNALTQRLRGAGDDVEEEELGASYCVESCESSDDCALGFGCEEVEDGDEQVRVCVPLSETCTSCLDRDQDGVGTGHCGPDDARVTPLDCDDANPLAYYDAENAHHPFPEQCHDDAGDMETYFYDLNCNGILDHAEQIGSELFGGEHCTRCDDPCSGAIEGGVLLCMRDASSGQPYCGVGCESGFASCGDPSLGCSINIEEERSRGSEQLYRDGESPYIWYNAPASASWATSSAEGHFFCSEDEALAALANPTQQRGCHPEEPGAHPGAVQLCEGIDWNCSGLTGPEDPTTTDAISDGTVHTVGDDCQVPGAQGLCAPGVALCAAGSEGLAMRCEPVHPQYPALIPYCAAQDTTCDGSPDYLSEVETYRVSASDSPIIVLAGGSEVQLGADDPVSVGAPCKVPGLKGECAIGEVVCSEMGLSCAQVIFPQRELPGFDGIDHSCDGWDRHLDEDGNPHVIYVDLSSTSPALPDAIRQASQCENLTIDGDTIPCDVFVQNASSFVIEETIELIEGVHVYGGFNPDRWNPTTGSFSAPDYTGIGSVSTRFLVNAPLGMVGNQIQESTHFYGVSIVTADRSDEVGCEPNIGMICRECEGLELRKVSISAGAAAKGAAAAAATAYPEASQPAVAGVDESYNNNDNGNYAVGGKNTGGWSLNAPSRMLAGGHGGRNRENPDPERDGQPGWGPRGGEGGASNLFLADGGDGEDGEPFVPEFGIGDAFIFQVSSSSPYLNLECPTYALPDKTTHFNLSAGGGGGGSAMMIHYPASGSRQHRMASGGSGGAPGALGRPGEHGGSSIAMVLIDTNADPNAQAAAIAFHEVSLTSSTGGAGGQGSLGMGGQGGAAGGATSFRQEFIFGYTRFDLFGGRGGDGAGGSGGFGGYGGASIGLLRVNSPIGTNHPTLNTGLGGSGGRGGNGGDAGGNGQPGHPGEAGQEGGSCRNFSVDAATFTFADFDANCVY